MAIAKLPPNETDKTRRFNPDGCHYLAHAQTISQSPLNTGIAKIRLGLYYTGQFLAYEHHTYTGRAKNSAT